MASYDEAYWHNLIVTTEPVTVMGKLKRIVENQEQKVTVALVDDLNEHQVLEALLEDSKPAVPKELLRLDYLLRSPWRYPPLKWGSRFSRRHEPGIFYGALSDEALFSEAAYYRFLFLAGMKAPFNDRVLSQHTIFEAKYQSEKGADLSTPPWSRRAKVLTSPSSYAATHALGSVLREHDYGAAIFVSARSSKKALNVALFKPQVLRSNKHINPVRGLCESHADKVMFRFNHEVRTYELRQFLLDGRLPRAQ